MHETPPVPEPLREALTRLADAGATGALHVAGTPGGTLWLVDGDIGYAETPVMPGIGDRLVATGRLAAGVWAEAMNAAKQDGQVGRWLVDRGHVGYGELVSRVLAAVYDTAYLLLSNVTAPTRFHPGLRHWLGPVTSVELGALDAETGRRQRLLGDVSGRPGAGPVVPGVPRPPAAPATSPAGHPGPSSDTVEAAISEAARITAAGERPEAAAPRGAADGPGSPNELPQRVSTGKLPNAAPQAAASGGTQDGGNGRSGPDYATLRRIRIALKSLV